jgi:hypothetical protein
VAVTNPLLIRLPPRILPVAIIVVPELTPLAALTEELAIIFAPAMLAAEVIVDVALMSPLVNKFPPIILDCAETTPSIENVFDPLLYVIPPTASALPLTLSFWVRSSLTGTFGGSLLNSNASKSYVFSYTINTANTWEQKSVTIAGDTAAALATGNNAAFGVYFSLGMGSTYSTTAGSWVSGAYFAPTGAVSVVGTSGATFYITGVQLEVGSVATSFDVRDYGRELILCQRYYYKLKAATAYANSGTGRAYSTTNAQAFIAVPVSMRAAPTGSYSSLSDWDDSGGGTPSAIDPVSQYGSDYRQMSVNLTGSYNNGQAIALNANGTTNAYVAWSAEL